MRTYVRLGLLLAAVLALALGLPGQAEGSHTWSTLIVDHGDAAYTSIAVDANGDPMISYLERYSDVVKFAICDVSGSANGNCDETTDWSTVTVDAQGTGLTSIAVNANGDPVMSLYDEGNHDLKFAICDRSESTNGNCDQTADWSTVAVDSEGNVGYYSSIDLHADGDPMISYRDGTNYSLKFAICDLAASANGNCDQTTDWSTVTVDSEALTGASPSIAVDANGDPMISYGRSNNWGLRFAICDLAASANGNCDQTTDWSTVTVDPDVGAYTSVAVDANGDPVISYYDQASDDLKFAMCELSASANGNCDQTADWSTVTVESQGDVGRYTSIAVDANGDPLISHHDGTNGHLKFAMCELSASANGNCDQTADWALETVDSSGPWPYVGEYTSIAVDPSGYPLISYKDFTNKDLKFATASPPLDTDCDEIPDASDNCPDDYNPGQEDADGDEWGDACDNCPTTATPWYTPAGDEDCDGFTTAVEEYVGTDPLDACADDPSDDAWPPDINRDTQITVADVIVAFYGKILLPENYDRRSDFNMSGGLEVADVIIGYYGRIFDTCS